MKTTSTAVITLTEGDYIFGVASLLNSLARSGFAGQFWIGHRSGDVGASMATEWSALLLRHKIDIDVKLVRFDSPMHFSPSKANFAMQCFERGDVSKVFYFDPDIVVGKSWNHFERWAEYGVALVEDGAACMSCSHPCKLSWRAFIENRGWPCRMFSGYVNAGFFGLKKSELDLLTCWHELCASFDEIDKDMNFIWRQKMISGDQDLLNVALMATDCPVSIVGPAEGMGFGSLQSCHMYHAAGIRKPWHGSAIWDAVRRGRGPTTVHRRFLDFLREPIPVYPLWREWLARCDYWGARALTSVVRR